MRLTTVVAALAVGSLFVTGPARPAGSGDHRSAYAGEESRAIKALSAQDVDDLLNGRGWGFAKVAELNGMPGPTHLLDMADEIALSPEQRRALQDLFDRMQAEAKALGQKFVALERWLDRDFANGTITPESLAAQLAAIAEVRGQLRLVHLRSHLQTPGLLTAHQIARYNRLRGYETPAGAHSHAH